MRSKKNYHFLQQTTLTIIKEHRHTAGFTKNVELKFWKKYLNWQRLIQNLYIVAD